jgi:SAM-dependent methyltransferase/ribosome-associated toxin RatA of RatAB toxin-antitoxin module/dienelactone hydrolase
MSRIESSIVVKQDRRVTYDLLKNVEEFPRFISGVENTIVKKLNDERAVIDWRVNIDGTIVNWKEKDYFNDKDLIIEFEMMEGDFATYKGEWQFLNHPHGTQILLKVKIDWSQQNLNEGLSHSLERKAKFAFRWMLREIRRSVNLSKTATGEELKKLRMPIISEVITYKNNQGKNIIGFFDHLKGNSINNPFVVIPHQYGATKREQLSIAYFLAKNGFNVVRYDCTDHIGESEGDVSNTKLRTMKNDLISTLNYISERFDAKQIGVVAFCLALRVAIKAAREDQRIKFLISVMGVVNLQDTLYSVYREDMIGTCMAGRKWGITDVLGFKVKGEFLETAIKDKFHDLSTTIEDARCINIPAVFLVAEKDAWVKLEDMKTVFNQLGNPKKEFHIFADAVHMFRENPKIEKLVLKYIVSKCFKYLFNKEVKTEEVIEPTAQEISTQNYNEKERLKSLVKITLDSEKKFWSEYVSGYSILIKSRDYRDYLALIINLLGGVKSQEIILDAGCGNGNFGACLLEHLFNKILKKTKIENDLTNLPSYVGIDFSEEALENTRNRINQAQAQFFKNYNPDCIHKIIIKSSYVLTDLNNSLPFENNYFDKICCSFVIPFVENPIATLGELFRILRPKKKIVVTSLKPYADLAEIYRNFLDLAKDEKDIIEARKMLSESGKIKQKESAGYYRFFSDSELVAIMVAASFKRVRVFKSFANQANVVVAEK